MVIALKNPLENSTDFIFLVCSLSKENFLLFSFSLSHIPIVFLLKFRTAPLKWLNVLRERSRPQQKRKYRHFSFRVFIIVELPLIFYILQKRNKKKTIKKMQST